MRLLVKRGKEMELTPQDEEYVNKAFVYQDRNLGWTFYNEREFLENLLQTRFNFLLVVYAMFFNVFFLTKCGTLSKIVILVIGLIITLLIWKIIFRIYKKVNVLLCVLYSLWGKEKKDSKENKEIIEDKKNKELNTSNIINTLLKKDNKNNENNEVNKFIGFYIPLTLVLTFAIGLLIYIIKFIVSCPCITDFFKG